MSSGEEWRKQARRAQAERAASRRRHPAGRSRAQPDRPGMLRILPATAHPDRQPPTPAADTTNTTEETTMTDQQDPHADHRDQLRALLAQAAEFTAALDEIAHDDDRRLLDVARQMVTWHAQLADALTVTAEAASQPKPVSKWEVAARIFEQQLPGQDEA